VTRLVLGVALVATAFVAALPVGATAAKRADDPKSLSLQVARLNLLHQYSRVWPMIDARDRQVTTLNFWETCKNGLAPQGLRVKSITAAARVETLKLPPLGTVRVTVVHLQTRYSLAALTGIHTAHTTIYWARSRGRWRALWTAADYHAYSHRRCPAA
jgi:hypothetical protein